MEQKYKNFNNKIYSTIFISQYDKFYYKKMDDLTDMFGMDMDIDMSAKPTERTGNKFLFKHYQEESTVLLT